MNRSRQLKNLFGFALIAGIALFFFACSPATPRTVQPNETATATPPAPTETPIWWVTNTPTLTSTQRALTPAVARPTLIPLTPPVIQPPACSFPLAQITAVESKPETYSFSDPRVVLTAPEGNLFNVAQWLPDNQRILMTEELRNVVIENDTSLREIISLYNPKTGETQIYAIRSLTDGRLPLWQPELNAVVYPIMNYYDIDRKNRIYKLDRQIWISYGNPDTVQMITNNLPQLSLAIKPDGSELIYLSDQGLSKADKSLKKFQTILFDPAHWDYAVERRSDTPLVFKMAWQPGTSLVFLYSEGAMFGGGYTFILDSATGQICELNLGGWAKTPHWSSDGRYLAFIRSIRYAFPTYSADLAILDAVTGNLTVLNVMHQNVIGLHLINDFAWAPDNRHLLAIGEIFIEHSQSDIALYLADFISGQSVNVISNFKSYSISPQDMAWSPDGSKLLIGCPANGKDRLCLISVQRTGQ